MSVISRLEANGVECYTRKEWGSPREADGSYARRRRTHPMPSGPARYHYVHITVTPDTDTKLEGFAGARKVESYGLSTPKMVSYQDLVTNEGRYFQGQDYGTKGTHTVNDKKVPNFPRDLNLYGYAVAIMQNVQDVVTDKQVRVIAMILAARELEGLVVKGAPVYPHRKFDWKACPGDKMVARLAEVERLKNQFVRDNYPSEERPMNPVQQSHAEFKKGLLHMRKGLYIGTKEVSQKRAWYKTCLTGARTAVAQAAYWINRMPKS